ncbi:Uncharacterized protein FWK35_00024506 [Aphis craccivora]|uniref:Uncharacterized protein n=1 Tax=Aphis craccivora TaxID=307492 RepID=A0A6G0VYK4_APHCR|nr:Uncharacterized protein FWK35_00024506 [Aphis craccivora]
MESYYNTLKITKVHLKADGKPKISRYFKWMYVVKPLYECMNINLEPVVPTFKEPPTNDLLNFSLLPQIKKGSVYFDDPNELVARLNLLISSQNAGNTGVNNEIISILEELNELYIIE